MLNAISKYVILFLPVGFNVLESSPEVAQSLGRVVPIRGGGRGGVIVEYTKVGIEHSML